MVTTSNQSNDFSDLVEKLELGTDFEKRNAEFLSLVRDVCADYSYYKRFELLYEKHASSIRESERDLVSILLCFGLLQYEEDNAKDFINEAVQKDSVRLFLFDLYCVPERFRASNIRYCASGTTSLILRGQIDVEHLAIKIVLPQHLNNSSIRRSTKNYLNNYGRAHGAEHGFAPQVFYSNDRVIVMRYAPGVTLEHVIVHKSDIGTWSDEEMVENISAIFGSICRALQYYATCEDPPLSHLDLNPRNIILNERANARGEPVYSDCRLIDFGPNFLFTERLANSTSYLKKLSEASKYVPADATETSAGFFSPKVDLYSVGYMILELLNRGPVSKEEVGKALDECWKKYPRYAMIIEDLIDGCPEKRALTFSSDSYCIFNDLEIRLYDAQAKFQEKVDRAPRSTLARRSVGMVDVLFPGVSALLGAESNSKQTGGALVSYSAHALIVSYVLVYCIGRFAPESYDVSHIIGSYPESVLYHSNFGDIWGWLICISFSFLATSYYVRVFSGLRFSSAFGLGGAIANTTMALNSFVYILPISYTMLFDPSAWPFCVFAGILPVVTNNYFVYRAVSKGLEETREVFGHEKTNITARIIERFSTWYSYMLYYAISILFVGFGILFGWAKDEWVYAVLVIVLNWLLITIHVIEKDGVDVRSCVERVVFHKNRLEVLRTSKT